MNILYIAISCSPYHGSEDKIGWNIPLESAKKNRVFVLTREDQRKYIEKYAAETSLHNIHFYYVDLPKAVKWLFNRGIYSIGLNFWHWKALRVAEEICRTEHIDIVYQITPVEFRSIGNYGSIPEIKFVCGPIAGGQSIPRQLAGYLTKNQAGREYLRSLANKCSRMLLKYGNRLRKCDFVLFANRETETYLSACLCDGQMRVVIPDVCVASKDVVSQEESRKASKCRFLVAARLVYLKGHSMLLDALAGIPSILDYECVIVGQGPMEEKLRQKCAELGLEKNVVFWGEVPYAQMDGIYDSADVLVMPSFREATGSVILEAMSKGLPVVTMNRFGGALLINEQTGWLFDGTSRESFADCMRDALIECICNPQEVVRRGYNATMRAAEFSWKKRVEYYQSIYESLVKAENE